MAQGSHQKGSIMTAPKLASTADGDGDFMRGRFNKAKGFLESAETLFTLGSNDSGVLMPSSPQADSFVDLCVDAGIAAADAICVKKTGRYSSSTDHSAAIALLQDATGRSTAKHLGTLVQVKNKAAYSAKSVDASDIHSAGEAARALVAHAEDII